MAWWDSIVDAVSDISLSDVTSVLDTGKDIAGVVGQVAGAGADIFGREHERVSDYQPTEGFELLLNSENPELRKLAEATLAQVTRAADQPYTQMPMRRLTSAEMNDTSPFASTALKALQQFKDSAATSAIPTGLGNTEGMGALPSIPAQGLSSTAEALGGDQYSMQAGLAALAARQAQNPLMNTKGNTFNGVSDMLLDRFNTYKDGYTNEYSGNTFNRDQSIQDIGQAMQSGYNPREFAGREDQAPDYIQRLATDANTLNYDPTGNYVSQFLAPAVKFGIMGLTGAGIGSALSGAAGLGSGAGALIEEGANYGLNQAVGATR